MFLFYFLSFDWCSEELCKRLREKYKEKSDNSFPGRKFSQHNVTAI